MMDLRQLIYCKQFNVDTQIKLLHIAGSSTWVEDLLDYIHELTDTTVDEDCSKDCSEVEDIVKEFGDFKTEVREIIIDILQDSQGSPLAQEDRKKIYEIDSDDLVSKLADAIDKILNKKIDLHRTKATIGGIECPIDS